MKKFPYVWQILVCAVLVFFDQITKYWARMYLAEKPKELIRGVFSFHYHENAGSIWGILQGKVDFLLIASLILFLVLIFVYVKMPKTSFYLPLFWIITVMIAGAIGNTIDRLFFGFVTDFLYFELIDFPIFNIADCYITICAIVTIILIITRYKEDEFTFLSFRRKDSYHAAEDTESDEN